MKYLDTDHPLFVIRSRQSVKSNEFSLLRAQVNGFLAVRNLCCDHGARSLAARAFEPNGVVELRIGDAVDKSYWIESGERHPTKVN